MPLSSKKVVEIVNSFGEESFTAEDIVRVIHSARERRFKGKKKTAPKKDVKDINVIHVTLSDLLRDGYLSRAKKGFARSPSFIMTGKLSISRSIANVDTGAMKIIVKKEDLGSAQDGDTVLLRITDCRKETFYGEVASVSQKSRDMLFAALEKKSKGLLYYRIADLPGENYACVQRQAEEEDEPAIGDFATVRLTGGKLLGNPEAIIVERFASGSDEYDTDRVIMRHSLPGPHGVYPDLVTEIDRLPAREMKNRKDYRQLLTVTIDGEHAKDFDDAVSFEQKGDINILYVHIADVSAFVAEDSALDKEAFRRGTSYYLGDRVIPMLPEILSNGLCSLRPDEDRLTLSAELSYDNTGKLVRSEFRRGRIRSAQRMTYTSAHELIEHPDGSELSNMITSLYNFMMVLKNRRLQKGRVDLQMTDFELIFEDGQFNDIASAPRYKSHGLVEEAMLSANEAVSKALREHQVPSLYRVHEPMAMDSLAKLIKFLGTFGISLNRKKELGVALQCAVEDVKGKPFAHVVNFIILRSMMQAFYGEKPMGHFGLGFRDYTHFTSPIRRYPDLIVHRCLKSLIDSREPVYTEEELAGIGIESSRLERIAQKAERDLFKLKSCRLMQNRIGEISDGVISGVSKYGIYVTLKDSPIEGMIPLRLVTDDYYVVLEDEFCAVGRRNGKRYTMGDLIKVKVLRADVLTMQIDFEFADSKKGDSHENERSGKNSSSKKRNSPPFRKRKR